MPQRKSRVDETFDRGRTEMAVGIRLKFEGGTQENYDAAHAVMDIEDNPPSGMIVHWLVRLRAVGALSTSGSRARHSTASSATG